ncbi:thiol reductant ABC exporter subunit CydD [Balneolaceae bacterium ANBcel3]|nr:thiol reductant ABC exporter subunit CydD [Balneolaceae bacterium ANBcel3]
MHSGITRRLFSLAKEDQKRWILIASLLFMEAISIIVMMAALSGILDGLFMGGKSISDLERYFFLLAASIFVRGALIWLYRLQSLNAASLLIFRLKKDLVQKTLSLGSTWTEKQNSGETSSIFVHGIEKISLFFSAYLPALLTVLIVPVVLALFVFFQDWLSGLILLLTGPLIPVFMSLIGTKASSDSQKQWKTLKRLSHYFFDSIQGLRTLRVFQHLSTRRQLIHQTSDQFRSDTMSVLKIAFLSALVLELFASVATALIAVEIGVRLITESIDFRTGLFILLLTPDYYLPFRSLGAQHHVGMEAKESAQSIFDVLDSKRILPDYTPTARVPDSPLNIRFDQVSFTYPGSKQPVFENCSFSIPSAKWTSLAGKSGSGKTTLTKLLLKQYLPDHGNILINEVPLQHISEQEWLENLSLLSQTIWLFDMPAWDNLKLARPDAKNADLIHAAKQAGIHETIESFPESYESPIGERGLKLSGGERQRFGLARAFLKDSDVLILDEATSSLDPQTEAKIHTSLTTLTKERHKTVMVIAHRLRSIVSADHIVFLEGNRAYEGTHTHLMQYNDHYRALFHNHTTPRP